jgi:hypothetical protein
MFCSKTAMALPLASIATRAFRAPQSGPRFAVMICLSPAQPPAVVYVFAQTLVLLPSYCSQTAMAEPFALTASAGFVGYWLAATAMGSICTGVLHLPSGVRRLDHSV